jgi:hypothetical protein
MKGGDFFCSRRHIWRERGGMTIGPEAVSKAAAQPWAQKYPPAFAA